MSGVYLEPGVSQLNTAADLDPVMDLCNSTDSKDESGKMYGNITNHKIEYHTLNTV